MSRKNELIGLFSRVIIMVLMISVVSGVAMAVPSVTVTSPNDGNELRDVSSITWSTSETGPTTTFVILVSSGGSFSVITDSDGNSANSLGPSERNVDWDTTTVSDGTNYKIKVEAWQSGSVIASDQSNSVFTVDNTVPTISSITTKDADGDGEVETATIIFSESVDDSAFSAGNFAISGVTASSINTGTADDNAFDVVLSDGISGTDVKDVTYTQGTGSDLAGNLLESIASGTISETDGAAPILIARTATTTTITTTFTENVDSASDSKDQWSVSGNTIDSVSALDGSGNTITITLDSAIATDATPSVTYTAGDIEDSSNNNLETATITPSDGLAPALVSAVASDGSADNDGVDNDDTVVLTFSENTNQPTINAGNVDTVLPLNSVVHSWKDGSGAIGSAVWTTPKVLTVTLSTGTSNPTIVVGDHITPSSSLTDTNSNAMGSGSATITGSFDDLSAPSILSARTSDNDGDGQIDRMIILFDEIMDNSVTSTAGFTIAGYDIGGTGAWSTTTTTDDTFTITLTESGSADTGNKPDITYADADGGMQDDSAAGNDLGDVVTATITESDGALPVLLSSITGDSQTGDSAETSNIIVVFSENIDSESIDSTDFSVEGNTVIEAAVSSNIVTLTLQDSLATDAVPQVSLEGDGVKDNNDNSQTNGSVTADDGLSPSISSAKTGDSQTGDSSVSNKIVVVFSEDLDGTSIGLSDISVEGSTVTAKSETNGVVTLTLGVALSTSATPTVSISGNGVKDNNDNSVTAGSTTPTDGLSPTMDSAETTSITTIDVTFSENINSSTVASADFNVDDNTVSGVSVSNKIITLTLGTAIGTGDTPDVSLVDTRSIDDNSGNSITSDGGLDYTETSADGIAPTFSVEYDLTSPVKTGTLTLTIAASENLNAKPTVSIDQQGTTDISDAVTTCGAPFTSCTYAYTVNEDTEDTYVDGTASVTISGTDESDNSATDSEPTSGDTFTIDTTSPTVELTSPNGGEFLKGNSTFTIEWTASDDNIADNSITLEYFDEAEGDGGDWVEIETGESNDGSYEWAVPITDSSIVSVRVTADDIAGNSASDESYAEFTIDSTNPSFEASSGSITSGAGEDALITATITDNFDVTSATLNYISVGDTEETPVEMTKDPDSDLWSGTIPSGSSIGDITYYIIASDEAGNEVRDPADGTYTITVNPGALDHFTISEVSSPQQVDNQFQITITAYDSFDNVKTDYSGTAALSDTTETISSAEAGFSEGVSTLDVSIGEHNEEVSINVADGEATGTSNEFSVKDIVLNLDDSLISEWNFISVPKTLEDKVRTNVFGESVVWEYNATAATEDDTWVTPVNIERGKGYWVSNRDDVGLNYASTSSPGGQPGFDIATVKLYQGWNVIGHMCTGDQDVNVAFPSNVYNNLFVLRYDEENDKFQIYSTQSGDQEFWQMMPGEGYWVFLPTVSDSSGFVKYTNMCSDTEST